MGDGEPRFWVHDNIVEDTNGPGEWQRAGTLVGIADEEEGGIIAYCHVDTAPRILAALRAQAGAE